MNKDEILKALRDKHMFVGATIVTSRGERSIIATNLGWKLLTPLGGFEYTCEELAEELSTWDEQILSIE